MIKIVWKCINIIAISPKSGMEQAEIMDTFWTYQLRMAISLGVRRLMVYGDSDLVVNQVMKEWDVRSPAMTGYCNAVRKLEKRFEGLELHHIPRLKNQAADDLAKIGSKREAIPSDVCLKHIRAPSIQEDPFTEEPPQPRSASDPTEV